MVLQLGSGRGFATTRGSTKQKSGGDGKAQAEVEDRHNLLVSSLALGYFNLVVEMHHQQDNGHRLFKDREVSLTPGILHCQFTTPLFRPNWVGLSVRMPRLYLRHRVCTEEVQGCVIYPGLSSHGRAGKGGEQQPASPAVLSSAVFFSILNFEQRLLLRTKLRSLLGYGDFKSGWLMPYYASKKTLFFFLVKPIQTYLIW